ncbi:LPS assembly protein LptD [Roseomonas sp. NAR14]|uniref:LPS-assembly protein LptD n=1 Tax=Roseomonas acroporae TaxID=2937791 RepID=A0A9X1Y3H8_9PROT|nr:LPS assembly protein LptD [Roseomonas acroporae]MCK8782841.1 LPS assembly protein LptD [Roseomonas acroporae]
MRADATAPSRAAMPADLPGRVRRALRCDAAPARRRGRLILAGCLCAGMAVPLAGPSGTARAQGIDAATAGVAAPPAAPATPPPRPGGLPGGGPIGAAVGGARAPADRNSPVTFTADEVQYDREAGVVTARGHVEAWQGERILRTDEFTYNRNTGVATARGHVQLMEPDGQVLFADYAELTGDMKEGVLEGLRGLLAANGRVAANGARRHGGTVTDFARVVYSSCDLCREDPMRAPLWQVRARVASHDQEAHRIEYRDATVQFAGIPTFYTPYLSHPDPSTPRASGFLFPTFGYTRFLGAFAETPYYWAIDDAQDLTIAPIFATDVPPSLSLEYRRRFNFGEIQAQGSIAYLRTNDISGYSNGAPGLNGHIFAKGRFTLDENWRAGFDVNRASNELYLRIYRFGARPVLPTVIYTEGFWDTSAYARIDMRAYQGLRPQVDLTRNTPYVLPNAYYERQMAADRIGGRLTWDVSALNVLRDSGADTRRLAGRLNYSLPRTDNAGGLWNFQAQIDTRGYWAQGQAADPVDLPRANGTNGDAIPRLAVDWRWPLARSAGEYGTQIIEPHVQLVTGPNTGAQRNRPNEDSIDLEFTDANLFALNRFTGRDRLEGGSRVDAAFRGAWLFPNGGQIEGLVGRSFRFHRDSTFFEGSGLEGRSSDTVARATLSPVPWLSLIGRARFDNDTWNTNFTDVSANVQMGNVGLSGGYLLTPSLPYLTPTGKPREEVSAGINTRIGRWTFGATGRYGIAISRPVSAYVSALYEDECFILDLRYLRRFAEDPSNGRQYASNTLLLFRIGLKTIGDFGFRAL